MHLMHLQIWGNPDLYYDLCTVFKAIGARWEITGISQDSWMCPFWRQDRFNCVRTRTWRILFVHSVSRHDSLKWEILWICLALWSSLKRSKNFSVTSMTDWVADDSCGRNTQLRSWKRQEVEAWSTRCCLIKESEHCTLLTNISW